MVSSAPTESTESNRLGIPLPQDEFDDSEWIPRLNAVGAVRDDAVRRLHGLLLRAARHQVSRLAGPANLGATEREEIVYSAANEAAVTVLSKLDSFEGRSRFTTWAYKFGILQAGVELRRLAWRERQVNLDDAADPPDLSSASPESQVEGSELARAIRTGMEVALTAHQRRVASSLLFDEIPIDVLAERMSTTRSALYKTLHDARKRLRAHLIEQGYLPQAVTGR